MHTTRNTAEVVAQPYIIKYNANVHVYSPVASDPWLRRLESHFLISTTRWSHDLLYYGCW